MRFFFVFSCSYKKNAVPLQPHLEITMFSLSRNQCRLRAMVRRENGLELMKSN